MNLIPFITILLTRSIKPFEFKNTYSNTLDFEREQDLGLYVHIPFCRKICSFCPYNKVLYNENAAKRYKEALLMEIEMLGSVLKEKKTVTSLYFGGGTPALMAKDLGDIIQCLQKYFVIQEGIGVELHPDDISPTILADLKSVGISMISVGVQSFNIECLSNLGRSHLDMMKKFQWIGHAKFDVVDVDLIFAIPGQTVEILLEDIEKAFSSGATQVSTYPFIDFTYTENSYKPLNEKEKRKMLEAITNYCKETGRERTSVWTFAKKDTEKYSSVTRDHFLGFGVSATTLLKKEFKINTFSIEGYIKRIKNRQLPTSLTLDFTFRQRVAYYLFWNAYSMEVDLKKFQKFFNIPLKKIVGVEFWICEKLGFVKKINNSYYLTSKGAYYYHLIEQKYTRAYIDAMWNISRNTSFPNKINLR